MKYSAQELLIPVEDKIKINVDSAAAKGFIENTCTIGRLKHIDLRQSWVQTLRDREQLEYVKVPGEFNKADFFTKIQSRLDIRSNDLK